MSPTALAALPSLSHDVQCQAGTKVPLPLVPLLEGRAPHVEVRLSCSSGEQVWTSPPSALVISLACRGWPHL